MEDDASLHTTTVGLRRCSKRLGNILLAGGCFLVGSGGGSPVLIEISLVFSMKEAPSGEDDASLLNRARIQGL